MNNEKILIFIKKSLEFLPSLFGRYKKRFEFYLLYKLGRRKRQEFQIINFFLSKKETFSKDNNLYQTHPDINLPGQRPTLARFSIYGLKDYVDSDKKVLDIGGNIGFFSLYVSKFVSNVTIVECNNNLCKIGNIAKKFLNINNVKIINRDIKKFKTQEKFDIVFSFAIHKWVDENFNSYINRILNLLDDKGIVIIESHPGTDRIFLKNSLEKVNSIKILSKGITDDHEGMLRDFYIIQKNV